MNVLVIGGAGYTGSHAVYALNDTSHTVTILDNFSTGMYENAAPRVRLAEGDMQDSVLFSFLPVYH